MNEKDFFISFYDDLEQQFIFDEIQVYSFIQIKEHINRLLQVIKNWFTKGEKIMSNEETVTLTQTTYSLNFKTGEISKEIAEVNNLHILIDNDIPEKITLVTNVVNPEITPAEVSVDGASVYYLKNWIYEKPIIHTHKDEIVITVFTNDYERTKSNWNHIKEDLTLLINNIANLVTEWGKSI